MTVGFSNLPLGTIAVYRMLEALLGYTDKHLYRYTRPAAGDFMGQGSHRIAANVYSPATEKRLNETGAYNMFRLLELKQSSIINYQSSILLHNKIVLQRTGHGWVFLVRGLNVQAESGLLGSFSRCRSEGCNSYVALVEVRKVFREGLYA